MLLEIIVVIIKILVVFTVVMLSVAYMTYVERKVMGHIQARLGPMRVGWHGLLQPFADALKLMLKEDIIPQKADKWIFVMAPFIVVVPAFVIYSVIPFSQHFYITKINIALLFILAISSLGVYGIILAGWSAGSKYSLLGSFRSASQMISYEIFLGFSLIGPVMLAGSLNLMEIVESQKHMWLIAYQPLAFVLYMIAATAETNRVPFDLPEAEGELVAGFHTEYSGMRFLFFYLAEYTNLFVVASLATVVFLGGWYGPFSLPSSFLWFALKVALLMFIFIWLRATLPRFRYDQLMAVGWKVMFPLALANIGVTGLIYYFVA